MCKNCVLYAVLGALALALLVGAIAYQWKMLPALSLDMATGALVVQYFVGLALISAAKYYKCQICCMPGMAKQSRRRR